LVAEFSKKYGILSLALILALIILSLDVSLPLGIAGGVPYVAAILLGLWFPNHSQIIIITLTSVSLTVVGYYLSPEGGISWVVISNRVLAIFAILITGFILYFAKPKSANPTGEDLKPQNENSLGAWNPVKIIGSWSIGVSILILFSVLGLTHFVGKETQSSIALIVHGERIQSAIGQTLSLLQDLETGQRGFILTGNSKYLQPFDVAAKHLQSNILNLQSVLTGSSVQPIHIETLLPLIEEKVSELEETILLRQQQGFDAALLVINTDVGKHVMDQIRVILQIMSDEESAHLKGVEVLVEKLQYYSLIITYFGFLLFVAVSLIIAKRLKEFIDYRRKSESILFVAQQKSQKANVAKSEFLSTMSHEIRTPLNGVLGLAQLLKDTDLDKGQIAQVDTILSSGQTLLAIINDVLDMSKIEAGAVELEERAFSLRDLISTITTPFQSLADDKGLKLIVNCDLSLNYVIKGDPVRLRQILWNLLSNAIKFTEEGHITIKVQVVAQTNEIEEIVPELKDQLIYFSIEDSGAGISSDRVGSIFDAFTQEDNTITRKHGGTGLGLSIVKQLVSLMGGAISVKSQIGEGSNFYVYMPFSNPTHEESENVSKRHEDISIREIRPLKIILAEDNEVNAVIAKSFLEKFGHEVSHVENGKLAVDEAADGWADLILMDIHMPEMNGIDATKAIRLTELGKALPIIGLTAEAFAERHVVFREAGMNDVLTKPFTEQQLADTLVTNRLVEQHSVNQNAE